MGGNQRIIGERGRGRAAARGNRLALAMAAAALLCIPASQVMATPKSPPSGGGSTGSSTGSTTGNGSSSNNGNASSSNNGNGNGGGNRADSITITKQSDLQFGRVVLIGSGGSIMLPADGLPSYSGLVSVGTQPTPARFEIRGPANKTIQLQLTFPLSGSYGSSGTANLDSLSVVADYTTAFKQDGTIVQVKLDSGGVNAISVGGKLTLNSDVPGKTNILIPISASVLK